MNRSKRSRRRRLSVRSRLHDLRIELVLSEADRDRLRDQAAAAGRRADARLVELEAARERIALLVEQSDAETQRAEEAERTLAPLQQVAKRLLRLNDWPDIHPLRTMTDAELLSFLRDFAAALSLPPETP